jgi:hypothetical protein
MIKGSNPDKVKQIFSSPKRQHRLSGPHSLPFKGYRGSLPGVKWPGREVDHSLISRADIKNV